VQAWAFIVHLSRSALGLPTIETPLRRADVPWLGAVVALGGIVGPLLLMFGLARTEAAGAALLLNLEGLATMGIAWVVFCENVDRRLLLGAFAILVGAALLSWQGTASFEWGALLITGACLCWGIDNNFTRKLSSADPVQIAMLKGLVAGTVNLALSRLRRDFPHTRRAISDRGRGIFRLWGKPCSFRIGFAPSRHGPHRGIFLAGSLYRGGACYTPFGRSAVAAFGSRRRRDGGWIMAAPFRAARTRTYA
jgi:hypothetical protein